MDAVASETRFSGVVRVDLDGETTVRKGYGFANRACSTPNRAATRLALASGAKAFTALAVVSLIEDGVLNATTPVRGLLGRDLPLVDDRVTIEHLLTHRSGIGDYLDEDSDLPADAFVLTRPAHELVSGEDYLPMLEGRPQKHEPGERFSYCNSGYVVLGIIAERATGISFHDIVAERVCAPASLNDTGFLRSDELPGDAALGYLGTDGLRTNVFHLPVLGAGDGGIYSTVDDVHALWRALFEGRIVSHESVYWMMEPQSSTASGSARYGRGFWLGPTGATALLEGADAGVSFRSAHDPHGRFTHTVISNTSDGAWPTTKHLEALLER